MKTYVVHTSVPGTGRRWRKIELRADQTLAELHLAIQRAFKFDNDHLYSFFMSGKAWDSESEYNLPEGVPPWSIEAPVEEAEEDVEETTTAQPVAQSEEDVDIDQVLAEIGENQLRSMFGNDLSMEEIREQLAAVLRPFSLPAYSEPGDVRKMTMDELNLEVDQEFMYLFDYGDEWRFKVRVHDINEGADPDADYPRIVESVGEPPPQYPDWDWE